MAGIVMFSACTECKKIGCSPAGFKCGKCQCHSYTYAKRPRYRCSKALARIRISRYPRE